MKVINTNYISFDTTSYVCTRAQALIWIANGVSVFEVFEKNASTLLSEIIKKTPSQKPIVANFTGIINIDEHALDDVFDALSGNLKQLIIINGIDLTDRIIALKKSKLININVDAENKILIIGNSKSINISLLKSERDTYIKNFISSTLNSTFNKFEDYKRLCSTPFLANGEFNSKKIISEPINFLWITLHLSDLLKKLIQEEKLNNIKLISASLRGAPFASMLGLINGIECETIDHVGPIHKVFDGNITTRPEKNINYIYVGDFIFGGTEIKIAKTYLTINNCKLNNAIVIGSLFDKSIFSQDFNLYYLENLRTISRDSDFKIFE